jgi:hypothetical protein
VVGGRLDVSTRLPSNVCYIGPWRRPPCFLLHTHTTTLLLFTGHEPSFAISVFGVAFNGSSSLLISYDFEHYGEPSAQITQENLFTEHLFRTSDSDSFGPLGKHIIYFRPTFTSTDHHTTSS